MTNGNKKIVNGTLKWIGIISTLVIFFLTTVWAGGKLYQKAIDAYDFSIINKNLPSEVYHMKNDVDTLKLCPPKIAELQTIQKEVKKQIEELVPMQKTLIRMETTQNYIVKMIDKQDKVNEEILKKIRR